MVGLRQPRIVYRFDQFLVDLARGTLRGPQGTDLALRPKAFSLLCYLLDYPGELHQREDLLETLWPGVTVTDDSLTQCISDLRRAFGSRADQILKTLPRRGYMLTADVDKQVSQPANAPPRTASAGLAEKDVQAFGTEFVRSDLVTVERHSASHRDDPAVLDEILGDLFMHLARFEDLRVVRSHDPTGGIGSAGYRIRGEARATGGMFHAAILLEDADTGVAIWAERIDRPIADIGMISETSLTPLAYRIARQIASESRRRARRKPPISLTSRELCLLASDHHQRGTEADTEIAHDLLDRAITLDPNYAPAYAWLAYVVQRGLTYGWGTLKGQSALDQALALARRGAVLAPDSPLSLSRLAYCLYLSRRWEEAVATARMALHGSWTAGVDERVTASEVLAQGGHAEEAVAVMRETLRYDPYSPPTVYSVLGRALLMARRPEDALPELRLCAARLPDYAACYHSLLMAAHESGRSEEARLAYEEIRRLQPGWAPVEGAGPWFFRNPDDAARLRAAYDAAHTASEARRTDARADVLSFRPREAGKRL